MPPQKAKGGRGLETQEERGKRRRAACPPPPVGSAAKEGLAGTDDKKGTYVSVSPFSLAFWSG